jgi:hypothetical protein
VSYEISFLRDDDDSSGGDTHECSPTERGGVPRIWGGSLPGAMLPNAERERPGAVPSSFPRHPAGMTDIRMSRSRTSRAIIGSSRANLDVVPRVQRAFDAASRTRCRATRTRHSCDVSG